MLRIRLLGGLALELDGRHLEPPPGARARSLLAWLAVHPGLHPRRAVAGTLRPDADEESARKSLRQAVWALRGALGPGGEALVVSARDRVGLAGGSAVWVDLAEFERLRDAGRAEEALALCRGELLAGLDDDWVHARRERHRAEIARLAGELAARGESEGDLAAAVDWTRRRIAAEPAAEAPRRDLVRLLALSGDRPAALAEYEALREALRRELGIAPSAESRELAEAVRAGGLGPSAPPPPLPPALLAGEREPVGRDEALRRLDAAWAHTRAGALVVAEVPGEAGIGKTTLAAAFARRVHERGGAVLYGRSDEEALVPYQPLVEALTSYLERLPPSAREALVAPRQDGLARLLPGLEGGVTSAAAEADPALERYRAFESVRGLLEAVAEHRAALLLLDDLHWADRSTLLLVRHLARMARGAPLALVLLYRDAEVEPGTPAAAALAELRREHGVTSVPLGPLGAADVSAILARRAPARADAALATALRERTGGNPLFLDGLLRHMQEGEASEEDGLPPDLREALLGRVRRLGAGALEVLTLAALMGPTVALSRLEAVLGAEAGERAVGAVERALAAGLVVETERGRYAFAHALVAESLADALSSPRRARWHLRIARALESPGCRAAPAEVAWHHLEALPAGDAEAAVRWSVAAAERATALLAHEEAARHLRAALSALPNGSDARRGPLHAALGEAHLRAGAADGARRAFADAAEAARSGRDEALLARAALGAGGLGVAVREADPALVGLLGEALAAVGAGRPPLRARLLARLAVERYYGDRDGALALSAEALECAAAADDPAALAVALNARRVALWSPDRVDERLAVSTRMVELAERAGDKEWALQGRNWRVVDLLELGRVPEVEREIDRYGEDADALGLPHFRWYVPLWRGGLSILAGRFAEAGRLAGEALALGTAAGDANAALFVGIQRWHGLYEAGRESEADRAFVEAGAARPPAGWAWLPGLARIHAAAGDPESARAALAPLAAHGFAVARLDANWHALLEAGEVAAALRESEWAARLYALLAPFAALNGVIARGVGCYGSSEYVLGLLAAATARPAEAESHLGRAVAENDRLGARPRAALARLHLARLLLARGARARARALAAEAARAAAAMGIETTAEAAHALRA